ncbi:hypothetical protein D3C72_1554490 [compost metagenome]
MPGPAPGPGSGSSPGTSCTIHRPPAAAPSCPRSLPWRSPRRDPAPDPASRHTPGCNRAGPGSRGGWRLGPRRGTGWRQAPAAIAVASSDSPCVVFVASKPEQCDTSEPLRQVARVALDMRKTGMGERQEPLSWPVWGSRACGQTSKERRTECLHSLYYDRLRAVTGKMNAGI